MTGDYLPMPATTYPLNTWYPYWPYTPLAPMPVPTACACMCHNRVCWCACNRGYITYTGVPTTFTSGYLAPVNAGPDLPVTVTTTAELPAELL